MKKYTLALLVFFTSGVVNADIERGESLYQDNCAICHGSKAQKRAMNRSAVIAGWDITKTVEYIKSSQEMGTANAAKSRLDSQSLQDIAEYLHTLK